VQENKYDSLIADYTRRKAELEAKWQRRKRERTQEEAFALFVRCILSSRTNWDRVVAVVKELQRNGLLSGGSAAQLVGPVRKIGGMVKYKDRAEWIEEDRELFPVVFWLIDSVQKGEIPLRAEGLGPKDIFEERDLQNFTSLLQKRGVTQEALRTAVKRLKGASDKQASHFLTSLGFEGYAIIDTYILDKLAEFGIIEEKPDNLTSSRYHAIEQRMKQWCNRIGIPMHLLDMLWWRGGVLDDTE
jgi:thermostable 8-oxoguanine DNA glycosylase